MFGGEKRRKASEASLLLASGASVNACSVDRSTPLLSACSRGFAQVAKTLLQHGASAEATLQSDDALRSALKFFRACRVYNACSRRNSWI